MNTRELTQNFTISKTQLGKTPWDWTMGILFHRSSRPELFLIDLRWTPFDSSCFSCDFLKWNWNCFASSLNESGCETACRDRFVSCDLHWVGDTLSETSTDEVISKVYEGSADNLVCWLCIEPNSLTGCCFALLYNLEIQLFSFVIRLNPLHSASVFSTAVPQQQQI